VPITAEAKGCLPGSPLRFAKHELLHPTTTPFEFLRANSGGPKNPYVKKNHAREKCPEVGLAYTLDLDPQDKKRLGTLYWKLLSLEDYFHPPTTRRKSQVCRPRRESTLQARLGELPGEYSHQRRTQFRIDVQTHRSGARVAKKPAVAAAGGARIWAGVYSEITLSSPPYSSRSPIVWDCECNCGTGGLFPARRLRWHGFSGVKICVHGWPGGACQPVVRTAMASSRTKS